jgi:transcriptional regulator with XRE-family HTH domain
MKRTQVASLLGCSVSTVANYERGDTQITLSDWTLLEQEMKRVDLFDEFQRQLHEHEQALAARRTA